MEKNIYEAVENVRLRLEGSEALMRS